MKKHASTTLAPETTTPRLPADEAPLDNHTRDAFLEGMGTDMVLVGGQALAFWMDRYDIAPGEATISNDGDALGQLELAQRIAQNLHAALLRPDPQALTSLVAQIRVPTGPDGRVRNIDVLHLLYTVSGLRKSREFTTAVMQNSVEIEWRPGSRIRVMNPLHVLDSRVQNAVGLLDEKGPHVLTQATWAVQVAHAAVLRVLAHPNQDERVGTMIRQIYNLARSRAGRQLQHAHGIEVLHAVPLREIRQQAPVHERQLLAVEHLLVTRAK